MEGSNTHHLFFSWHDTFQKRASNTFFYLSLIREQKDLPIPELSKENSFLPALNQGEDNPNFGNGSVLTFCCNEDRDMGKVDDDIAILPNLEEGPSLLPPLPPVVIVPTSPVPPLLFNLELCKTSSPKFAEDDDKL